MKWNWNTLQLKIRALFSPQSTTGFDAHALKEMARGIMTTRPDEIGCAECFDRIDSFVEIELAGRNAAEAMPLVQDHLDRCGNCREEFEALLAALRAVA
jgi:hypothetical protein